MGTDIQKAMMWKRICAFLMDFILLAILTVGIACAISAVSGYDKYNESFIKSQKKYEQEYGISFVSTKDEYENLDEETKERYDDAYAALNADPEVIESYGMIVNLTLVISTVSILVSFLTLEFAVPCFFKNGQTFGKRLLGICVTRADGVKVNVPIMLIRSMLGKFTLETMIPVLLAVMIYFRFIGLLGPVMLGILLLFQLILVCTTANRTAIHDLLAKTVAVDITKCRIFQNEEEMTEYIRQNAAAKDINISKQENP